jgi:enterochelin esterase-like enzyme
MTIRDFPDWPAGEIRKISHHSRLLADNPWGDPAERDLCVYLPPGYADAAGPYIALWDFAAFTNAGPGHLNWKNHGENLPQRLDRLIHEGYLPPLVVAMPDCYTSLGGNQYINSSAVGAYADYVVEELVPLLSSQVNVVDHRDGRGVFGKSSGGYGALVHAMQYPEIWGAAASHAGDVGFDLVYRADFPRTCMTLAEHDGDVLRFIEHFWRKKRPGGTDYSALMTIAMAASYDPDPSLPAGFALPFDIETCSLSALRWARWLANDPLNLVEQHAEALNSLHALYLDAGSRDQYNIQFGTRLLSSKMLELGIEHHHEEFTGTHSGIDWRLDHSLPVLAKALSRASGMENFERGSL